MKLRTNSKKHIKIGTKLLLNQLNCALDGEVVSAIYRAFEIGVNPVQYVLKQLNFSNKSSLIQKLFSTIFCEHSVMIVIDGDADFEKRFHDRDLFESRSYNSVTKLKAFRHEAEAELIRVLNNVIEGVIISKSEGRTLNEEVVTDIYMRELSNEN